MGTRRASGKQAWALALLLAACRGGAPAGEEAPRRYTVRGEVVQLAGPAGAGAQVVIRHEAIDDFVDQAGRVVGMDAMVMPFEVAPPVSAGGLAVGDKVAIRFAMDWKGPRLRVERIERLPADTVLRFGPARPAGR